MITQTETILVLKIGEENQKSEHPMQERHCERVAESHQVAADKVFAARRLEVQNEAGHTSTILFVP